MNIFNEIIEVVGKYPNFESYELRAEPALKISGLEIYPDRRKIYRDRREISLTVKEYDLLYFLVMNRGRVLTYDQIYQKVWGDYTQDIESNNTIGFHICNLREKLFSASPDAPFTIRCERSVGYCFELIMLISVLIPNPMGKSSAKRRKLKCRIWRKQWKPL